MHLPLYYASRHPAPIMVNGVGLIWAQTAVVNLFSGALAPLAFFPGWLRAFAAWAPFQGIITTPLVRRVHRAAQSDGLDTLDGSR